MPSQATHPNGFSSMYGRSSFFSEDFLLPAERKVGFWKPEFMPSQYADLNGITSTKGSTNLLPFLGKNDPAAVNQVKNFVDVPNGKGGSVVGENVLDHEKSFSMPTTSWKQLYQNFGSSLGVQENGLGLNNDENSLFSSSLSDVFTRKLRLASDALPLDQSFDILTSHLEDDEPLESLKEIEAQTIGNLLPDDDDLFSGVLDEIEAIPGCNKRDDAEDVDLFSTGGGMELEADDCLSGTGENRASDFPAGFCNGYQVCPGSPFAAEHPYGEHPSRTLFVRNINSNVEDSELKALFEQYGDIRTLYTACKHRGFVMISYFDIRAARNAMKGLQNKLLRRRKLDIHFSIPKDNPSEKDINQGTLVVFNLDSSVTNDELHQIFGVYGEIKEIRETPHKHHHKFIEFYDVRAAEAALRALNRSDIAGKRIKLEPSRPGGARRLMQQFSPDVDQEEMGGHQQHGNPGQLMCTGSFPIVTTTAGCLDNCSSQGLNSTTRLHNGPFVDPLGISSIVSCNMSSPVMMESSSVQRNQSAPSEFGFSPVKPGYGSMPTYHAHSLAESHGDASASILHGLVGTMPAISAALNARTGEIMDNHRLHGSGFGGPEQYFEPNQRGFGSPGNGACHLPGPRIMWSNTNCHRAPPAPTFWPNSLPYLNGVHSNVQHQMHGLPGAPSHLLNSIMPIPHSHNHHVGSAPTMDHSLWERHHACAVDSPEHTVFHPSSLGSMGFPGVSSMLAMDLASRNTFPHASRSFDANIPTLQSPQQRCHMFPNRGSMGNPVPGSYDGPVEHRARSRRSDVSPNQIDNRKQYELDIDRIKRSEDSRTTLMIKNIPNKYTSKMLLAAIDENHRGTYDFIYLPIDFKNKCNVGYAFINMIDASQIIRFYQAFNGKKWEKFNSEKVASLAYARIQGKAALIAHFQNSSLMNEDKRCRPILFHSDGPNAGDQEPFPMGVNIRSRLGRNRMNYNSEETHQGSPSAFANTEEGSTGAESSSGSSKELE